jgi:hypothetical protein
MRGQPRNPLVGVTWTLFAMSLAMCGLLVRLLAL